MLVGDEVPDFIEGENDEECKVKSNDDDEFVLVDYHEM